MKYKHLSICDKFKLSKALLSDKDNKLIFKDLLPLLKNVITVLQKEEVKGIIGEYAKPRVLQADTNEKLQREVDIWYDVMYLNKDQKGRDLKTHEEIEREKKSLMRRVGHISNCNVSKITNMSSLFFGKTKFNHDISNWNVSNVTNMYCMFYQAESFDQPLNKWERKKGVDGATSTSTLRKVTNMCGMFGRAKNFNQPLNDWNVSNVTDMSGVFWGARKFNQPLNNWDVSNVTNMYGMFCEANSFNQPLNKWNTSNVTKMNWMFLSATSFNQDLNTHYETKRDYKTILDRYLKIPGFHTLIPTVLDYIKYVIFYKIIHPVFFHTMRTMG